MTIPPPTIASEPERLSPLDASFLYLERPTEPLHVGAVAVLAAAPSLADLTAILRERLVTVRRYRQVPERPLFDWSLPVWREVGDFDLRRHVQRTVLPAPGDEAMLRRVLDALFARPFAVGLPLWECHLIDGLADGRAVVLVKAHHCMIDGVSGVQVLELLTSRAAVSPRGPTDAADGAGASAPAGDPEGGGWLAGTLDAVAHPRQVLARVQEAVAAGSALAGLALAPSVPFPWNGALGGARAVRWQGFGLDQLLAMRGAAGCKVDDVALAIIAGALRAVVPPSAVASGRRARALVPVSTRRAEEYLTLGNRLSGRFAALPLDVRDPLERLRLITGERREQRSGAGVRAFDVAVRLAGALPAPLTPWLAHLNDQWSIVHTICTNVPGPSETRALAGQAVLEIHPIVPLAAGIGLGFAMMSYAGRFSITATADPALLPAVDRLPAALAAAAAELAGALGVGAAGPAAARPLGAPTVGDLMTCIVTTVAPDTRLSAAWNLMRTRRIRHLPVLDRAGRLIGLLTHRDLLAALPSSLGVGPGQAPELLAFGWAEVRDLMEPHLSTAAVNEPAAVAGRRMARQKIGCLPVVGAHGELVGVVTEEDFLRWATDHMAA